MIDPGNLTIIGKFRKTHALKGELNATMDVDSDFLSSGDSFIVEMDGIFVPFFVESIRSKGSSGVLIKIDHIDTEDSARRFVNKDIYADRNKVREFEDDEDGEEGLYAEDLVGFEVYLPDGNLLGKVERVDISTANVLLEVDCDGRELLIPLADEFIVELNPEEKKIIMDIPEGIIELSKN